MDCPAYQTKIAKSKAFIAFKETEHANGVNLSYGSMNPVSNF